MQIWSIRVLRRHRNEAAAAARRAFATGVRGKTTDAGEDDDGGNVSEVDVDDCSAQDGVVAGKSTDEEDDDVENNDVDSEFSLAGTVTSRGCTSACKAAPKSRRCSHTKSVRLLADSSLRARWMTSSSSSAGTAEMHGGANWTTKQDGSIKHEGELRMT